MALPALNTFAGNPLDRAGDRRNDPEWLAEQAANPAALAMMLWQGRPLLEETANGPRLAWTDLTRARAMAAAADREVFLGLWKGAPVFAVEFEGAADPAGEDSGGPVAGLGVFSELREAAAVLPGADAAMAGGARSLFEWSRRHGFCANCGQATQVVSGGWKRRCPNCSTEHFPRVDPVTIMLPVFQGRCLLGRQAAWPKGRMSALAGFLEPGETIEEGCAREIAEEAGLTVTAVRYHSSQPWPFPSQLMIGLIAEVSDDEAAPDQTELEEVRWFTRDEARAVLAGAHEVKAPPRFAIARTLLEAWVEGEGLGIRD